MKMRQKTLLIIIASGVVVVGILFGYQSGIFSFQDMVEQSEEEVSLGVPKNISFVGYYTSDLRVWSWGGTPEEEQIEELCDAFVVLEEEGALYEEFVSRIEQGNGIQHFGPDRLLRINLDMDALDASASETIKESSKEHPVRIYIEEKGSAGTYGGQCHSFVKITSVELM